MWDGLSYQEIAEIVGKSEGNCKVIYSRTLKELRGRIHPAAFLLLLTLPTHLL
jgi:DNA-directed RNA polymerase specialized sigma24 family protein